MLITNGVVLSFLSDFRIIFVILGIILALILIFVLAIVLKIQSFKRKLSEEAPTIEIAGSVPERLSALNTDLAPYGFAYEINQDVFYSILDPWQRAAGYCRLYDEACAPLGLIIDCEPIRFEYNGKKWLIEFWKGQYGMTTGGEVGIYYTTGPDLDIPNIFNGTFYFSPRNEEFIPMSFVLRKNGNLLITRGGVHWWLTGFKLGEFSDPSELTMDIVMDLYDSAMVNAFIEALREAGYDSDEYAVQGLRVYVRFATPHTAQPLTRTAVTDKAMQKSNKSFVDSYLNYTKNYSDTLDKIEVIKVEAPQMYHEILNPGKTKHAYDGFDKIKAFYDELDESNDESVEPDDMYNLDNVEDMADMDDLDYSEDMADMNDWDYKDDWNEEE